MRRMTAFLAVAIGLAGLTESRADESSAQPPPAWADTITRAGNAECDKVRVEILSELRKQKALPPGPARELDVLLPVLDMWANGREKPFTKDYLGYLCADFYRAAEPGSAWPGKVAPDSPLYPIWAFYHARALLWKHIELFGYRDRQESYFGAARKLLKLAGDAYPENSILAMYNGKALPWPAEFQPDPAAPEWANLQREGLEKLADVIHWWIDERQTEDGQYGGGWDDDVEMWRWWTPILVAFEDPKIAKAQAKLSRGILGLPRLAKGYTADMSDVEHTSEDTADAITAMLFIEPDSQEWRDRALRIVELARTIWMGENARGFLQFKSTYFNVHGVDTNPNRACDSVYHPRVLQPALLHWQRSGDKRIAEVVTRWMETWVDAAARAENGKPAGIVPSVIHWPDGQVGGGVEPWWKPQNHTSDPLYVWPSAMAQMLQTLLLTGHMTGNGNFFEPIRSMAAIRLRHLKDSAAKEPEPGSEAWCASQMARFLPGALSKYRLLTGDAAFDELLAAEAGGYFKMRLGGGREPLVAELEANAAAFRINKPGFTSEVRFTDRVLTFNQRWGRIGNKWDWPAPKPEILYACATGDPGSPLYFPMNAVRWLTEPRAFAALVTESGPDRFAAELYHFGDESRKMEAELYLLKPGKYSMELIADDKPVIPPMPVTVAGPRTSVAFDLPARTLCLLRIHGGN